MQSRDYAVDYNSENIIPEEQKFTGSQISYYFICKRKLWLFSHNIELEAESDLVKLGKLLHENRYKKNLKEIQIDRIKIDFLEGKRPENCMRDETTGENRSSGSSTATPCPQIQNPPQVRVQEKDIGNVMQRKEIIVHELKRSRKMQDAHLYQLLYYMYYLKTTYDVNVSRGVLHYPLLKQNLDVILTPERKNELLLALEGISEVNSRSSPPVAEWKKYCRSCAYQDLCWG